MQHLRDEKTMNYPAASGGELTLVRLWRIKVYKNR